MRVSKVNVKVDVNGKKVNKMVLMHRSTEKGALIYTNEQNVDRTKEIIPSKKRESFDLSILNKTLIRYETVKKQNLDRNKYKDIEAIFKSKKLPGTIDDESIIPFLNHKFHFMVTYYKKGDKHSFALSECIKKAVTTKNINELQPYYDWVEWYIADKSEKIKKSIVNNLIPIDNEPSKRQKALLAWEKEFTDNGKLELREFHNLFNTDILIADLCRVEMGELRDNGTPKDSNAYHRKLKKALQDHQSVVFGKRDNPNVNKRDNAQLAIYNLEIVKYLEHYFPIKSSERRNTADDISYYLKTDTLKNTITRQLENALRASLLRNGKYQHHGLNADTTSDNLTNLKRDEAFVMNLITTSAFAANNIRNIVDSEQAEDILVKRLFTTSLQKDKVNLHTYKLFFPEVEADINAQSLWAMRGAVQQIRNNVAHYKKDALKTIFNVTDFEFPSQGDNPKYSETIYKQLFEKELEKLPEAFALQLKSGGVLAQYSFEHLKQLLEKVEFQLCRTVVPFAPGFKKVMKGGSGYQNSKQDEKFYNLELNAFRSKDDYSEEAWNGRYFLLKTIYNYLFLPEFMDNSIGFANTVAWLLKKNKLQAQGSNAYAFADVRFMQRGESIADYMAYVQSQWMHEQNKKEDSKEDDTRINFEKFVLQLFIKGFDSFLQSAEYAFINVPQPQINLSDSNQLQADKLNALEKAIRPLCRISRKYIKPEKDEQIAFYVYCKLLDANHLSALRNELIKFRLSSGNESLNHLPEIIELCLIGVDTVPTDYRQIYATRELCLDRLKPFVADGADYAHWSDLYVQTDQETPVIHAGIELSVKYGTAALLKQLIASQPAFKINDDNFSKWNNLKKDIQEKMAKHTEFHKAWVEAKEKDDKERRERVRSRSNFAQQFIRKNEEDYINNCIEINNYNWLDNKLHFEHLKRLHSLTIELLGRMAGFVALWERDFQYMDRQRVKLQGGALLNFDHGVPNKDEIKPHDAYFKRVFLCDDYRKIRNHIAHFIYLTTTEKDHSLIDMINWLRKLLHYDRKLKNAVSNAFIDLFDKHGMVLKLKFDDQKHELLVESIYPKKIYHLGTSKKDKEKGLTTNQVQTAYCNLCKALLEMTKEH